MCFLFLPVAFGSLRKVLIWAAMEYRKEKEFPRQRSDGRKMVAGGKGKEAEGKESKTGSISVR